MDSDNQNFSEVDILKLNASLFNLAFLFFTFISLFLFTLGTGGWTSIYEIPIFLLFFVAIFILCFVQIAARLFTKKRIIVVNRKTLLKFLCVLIILAVFLTFFSMGDCGDAGGAYNLIKKLVMQNNACRQWAFDSILFISFMLFFPVLLAYFVLLCSFNISMNRKAQNININTEGQSKKTFSILFIIFLVGLIASGTIIFYLSVSAIKTQKWSKCIDDSRDLFYLGSDLNFAHNDIIYAYDDFFKCKVNDIPCLTKSLADYKTALANYKSHIEQYPEKSKIAGIDEKVRTENTNLLDRSYNFWNAIYIGYLYPVGQDYIKHTQVLIDLEKAKKAGDTASTLKYVQLSKTLQDEEKRLLDDLNPFYEKNKGDIIPSYVSMGQSKDCNNKK